MKTLLLSTILVCGLFQGCATNNYNPYSDVLSQDPQGIEQTMTALEQRIGPVHGIYFMNFTRESKTITFISQGQPVSHQLQKGGVWNWKYSGDADETIVVQIQSENNTAEQPYEESVTVGPRQDAYRLRIK